MSSSGSTKARQPLFDLKSALPDYRESDPMTQSQAVVDQAVLRHVSPLVILSAGQLGLSRS